jgi:hypothetical protein
MNSRAFMLEFTDGRSRSRPATRLELRDAWFEVCLPLCAEVMTVESHGLAGPHPHLSFSDCDNPISTISERPEHATSIGARWQPEMHFKCLARNRTLCVANPAGQEAAPLC